MDSRSRRNKGRLLAPRGPAVHHTTGQPFNIKVSRACAATRQQAIALSTQAGSKQ